MVVVVVIAVLIVFFLTGQHKERDQEPVERDQEPTINEVSYLAFYNTRNIMIVYAYLAGWIMKKNVSDSREKMKFIRLYFNRCFKGEHNVSEEMTASLRNETDVDSIISWLNRKMKMPAEKQQLVEFLIALSMEDGAITQTEFDALIWFGTEIGFSQPEVEQWIQTKKDQQYRQQQSQRATPVYKKINKKQQALRILGADESATELELKKLYRKLVKLHHPDTLLNVTTAEKEKAEERFIEIQEAYEYLLSEV